MSIATLTYRGIQIVNLTHTGYIYLLFEKKPDETLYHYVGMTMKVGYARIDEHMEALEQKTHHNHKLQALYDSREDIMFSVAIIETVIASSARDLTILLRHKEKEYIKKYKPSCNITHNKTYSK